MIIVAGIARSGLTVTMQMLDAGGYPCAGEYPGYEPFPIMQIPWHRLEGKAVKAVDVQLQNPPESGHTVIRLHRNLRQQAKSHNKLNASMGLGSIPLPTLVGSLENDYRWIDQWTKGHRTLHLYFEKIIQEPLSAAKQIAGWLGEPLDVEKMAAVVVKRSPRCYPTMLEVEMVRGAV